MTPGAHGKPDFLSRQGVRSPKDLAAGVFLLILAAIAYWGTLDLGLGRLAAVGPGMVPKTVVTLIAIFGLFLVGRGFLVDGPDVGSWPLRGAFFVLGAAVIFSWTIRPLGLVIAGPLAVIFSAFADRQTRLIEVVIFAAAITAFCVLLFSTLLRLPIPILPTGLPYPFDHAF